MGSNRHLSRFGILVGGLLALFAVIGTERPVAAQGDPTISIVNRSRESIYYVYVWRTGTTRSTTDLLGSDDVISTGERFQVSPMRGSCLFDIRVVYSNDQSEERRNQNFCQLTELVFTGEPAGSAAPASNADFDLVNDSTKVVYRLFVSLVAADNWGDDRLGSEVIAAGARFTVTLPRDGQCQYDVKVEYADETTEERRNLNLCELYEVVFTGSSSSRPGGTATETNPDFDVVNRSRQIIYYLHVSPVSQDNWGDDRLPGTIGSRFKVVLPRNNECRYDVRVVFEDGAEEVKLDQNVCSLSELAFDGSSSTAAPPPAPGSPNPTGGGSLSYGTGFFVSPQGHALTNNHVAGDCRTITAVIGTQRLPAQLVRRDERADLAVIKVQTTGTVPFAPFRALPGISAGEPVLAAGFPLPDVLQNGLNVTVGNVSALAGLRGDVTRLQITAPIQGGNSGGPLLDMGGNIVGVVVSKLDPARVESQNVNFAVQGSVARQFLEASNLRLNERQTTSQMPVGDVSDRAATFTFQIECRD